MSTITNNPEWDEGRLVKGLREGEDEAYRILVSSYQSRLINLAYGITLDREESLDIVQEVFLKVYTKIEGFEEKSSLYTWLRKITLNESLNLKRKWKRRFKWQHQSIDDDQGFSFELGTSETEPERLYRKKELEKLFNDGLNILPENARSVLFLRDVEELSYEEIGKLLGIGKGTVSSRVFYAREKLRKFLKDY